MICNCSSLIFDKNVCNVYHRPSQKWTIQRSSSFGALWWTFQPLSQNFSQREIYIFSWKICSEKGSYIFSKKPLIFCKKETLKKSPLYFEKFLTLVLRNFLYFLIFQWKKTLKSFLFFRKCNFLSSSPKNKKSTAKKIPYISGNGTQQPKPEQ